MHLLMMFLIFISYIVHILLCIFCPHVSLTVFISLYFEFLFLYSQWQLKFPCAESWVSTSSDSTLSFSAILPWQITSINVYKWQQPNLYLHSSLFYTQTYISYCRHDICTWISSSVSNLTTWTLDSPFRIYCHTSDHTSAADTTSYPLSHARNLRIVVSQFVWTPLASIS